jgi:hypothetical protein
MRGGWPSLDFHRLNQSLYVVAKGFPWRPLRPHVPMPCKNKPSGSGFTAHVAAFVPCRDVDLWLTEGLQLPREAEP